MRLVAIWCTIDGMHVEVERSFWEGGVGKAPQEHRLELDMTHDIQEACIREIAQDVSVSHVYDVYMARLTALGRPENRLPRIGHGIGKGPHERFSLSGANLGKFAKGMSVTVEPHFFEHGKGRRTMVSDTVCLTYDQGRVIVTRDTGAQMPLVATKLIDLFDAEFRVVS
jgi:Xaa-Pro aminopeptidase